MKTILFLSDSVNRRFLSLYNESGLKLPNLERLAARSITFDNHFTASAPCMPARRDIMTGRVNFLERNWGPIEPIDDTMPAILGRLGVFSHMETDHYHYLETGGGEYCQRFNSWVCHRGQETDVNRSKLGAEEPPEHIGTMNAQYWRNRKDFCGDESLYPSAVTITEAANWLEEHKDSDDFLLWIEPFDPHEPFDVPQKYLDMIGDDYNGALYMWPEYRQVDLAGVTPEQLEHVKRRYLALLLMVDTYLGKLLDVMDKHDLWRDTAFIYTTDHGYMLGEHNYLAKNYMPAYNEVFHIPFVLHLPEDAHAGERISSLTQNIDILPTLVELYGSTPDEVCRNPLHGKSLIPLVNGDVEKLREGAIFGLFGKQMNVTDGRFTYMRSPTEDNRPLNVYTTSLAHNKRFYDADRLTDPALIECGQFLPWTRFPVYKIPADIVKDNAGKNMRFIYLYDWEMEDRLFDHESDYAQENNIVDSEPETVDRLCRLMSSIMQEYGAPEEQFERMRLGDYR